MGKPPAHRQGCAHGRGALGDEGTQGQSQAQAPSHLMSQGRGWQGTGQGTEGGCQGCAPEEEAGQA